MEQKLHCCVTSVKQLILMTNHESCALNVCMCFKCLAPVMLSMLTIRWHTINKVKRTHCWLCPREHIRCHLWHIYIVIANQASWSCYYIKYLKVFIPVSVGQNDGGFLRNFNKELFYTWTSYSSKYNREIRPHCIRKWTTNEFIQKYYYIKCSTFVTEYYEKCSYVHVI